MIGAFAMDSRPSTVAIRQGGEADSEQEPPLYRTDEFRIFCMKVLPCSKRYCHDWTTCPFSHPNEKARRRDPRLFNYTGIACPDMKKDNTCVRGDQCPYAHNVFEYWLHPTRYRTQLCNDGVGCSRRVCFFAHTLQELRVPSSKPFVNPETLAAATTAAEATKKVNLRSMSDTTSTGNQSFAALSAHLAGMHFGQGATSRHTSLPAALDAPATDSNLQESAVVQLLRALLRQQLESNAQPTTPVSPFENHAATHSNPWGQTGSTPNDVASQMPSAQELAAMFTSMPQPGNTSLLSVPETREGAQGESAWQPQQVAVAGGGNGWDAAPRTSLDMGDVMASGGVRGGDPTLSSMPAYTLDYTGNMRNVSQELRQQTFSGASGGGSCNMERMDGQDRCSLDFPRKNSFFESDIYDPRRASADEVRRASFEMGAGVRNAAFQQVYNQAYHHAKQEPPRQAYQNSSLYAPTTLGTSPLPTSGTAKQSGGKVAHFNPDTFGNSLLGNCNSFAPHGNCDSSSHSGHSSAELLTMPFAQSIPVSASEGMAATAGFTAYPADASVIGINSGGYSSMSLHQQRLPPGLQHDTEGCTPTTRAADSDSGAPVCGQWRY